MRRLMSAERESMKWTEFGALWPGGEEERSEALDLHRAGVRDRVLGQAEISLAGCR